VTGPLGDPVRAEWRLDRGTAVIEMARASGLELVGGPDRNDPVAASTVGTGELIGVAVDSGAWAGPPPRTGGWGRCERCTRCTASAGSS
jgi:glycerate kinase